MSPTREVHDSLDWSTGCYGNIHKMRVLETEPSWQAAYKEQEKMIIIGSQVSLFCYFQNETEVYLSTKLLLQMYFPSICELLLIPVNLWSLQTLPSMQNVTSELDKLV